MSTCSGSDLPTRTVPHAGVCILGKTGAHPHHLQLEALCSYSFNSDGALINPFTFPHARIHCFGCVVFADRPEVTRVLQQMAGSLKLWGIDGPQFIHYDDEVP